MHRALATIFGTTSWAWFFGTLFVLLIGIRLFWRATWRIFPELLEFDPEARRMAFYKPIANNRTGLITWLLMPLIFWIVKCLPDYLPRVFPFLRRSAVPGDLSGAIALCLVFFIILVCAPLLSRSAVREELRKELPRCGGGASKRNEGGLKR